MRFSELEPKFYGKKEFDPAYPNDWYRGSSIEVDNPAEAHELCFLCPVCFLKNGGSKGTHSICICTPAVPVTIPGDGRWAFEGTGAADLTLSGRTPDNQPCTSSVLIPQGCKAHFFVQNGEVKFV